MRDIMQRPVVMEMIDLKENILWYKLQFKQLSPIHIGQKNYGVLSETRLFIPGWTMWGALVNSYGKLNGGKDEDFTKGKKLFEKITCFYLMNKYDKEPMFLNFKGEKLYIGDMEEKEFRIRFTDTYVSTSIEPEHVVAEDASFHETEIILPRDKRKKENLYWVGLLGVEENKEDDFQNFMSSIEDMYVGGDATYGFGKMKVIKEDLDKMEEKKLGNWGLTKYANIKTDNNELKRDIKNYVKFNNNCELKKGKLEFIVQYDFSKKTPSICKKDYYYMPGSEIDIDRTVERNFTLKKGIFTD